MSSARRAARILRGESEVKDSSTPDHIAKRRERGFGSSVTVEEWLDREYCSIDACDEPVFCEAGKHGDDAPVCYVHLTKFTDTES